MAKKKTTEKNETAKKADSKKEVAYFKDFADDLAKTRKLTNSAFENVDPVSTGFMWADLALNGGVGNGVSAQIAGDEGTGKTNLAYQIIASWQKMFTDKVRCIYIDTEGVYNAQRAKDLGVDLTNLYVYDTDKNGAQFSIESVILLIDDVIKLAMKKKSKEKGIKTLVVWDSIANTEAQKMLESKDPASFQKEMGLRARVLGVGLRKIMSRLKKANLTILGINQFRSKLDNSAWGKKTTTPGGKGLKFAFYQMIELSVIKRLKKKGRQIVRLTTIKNKGGAPHIQSEGVFDYMTGFSDALSFLYFAKKKDNGPIMKYYSGSGWKFLSNFDKLVAKNCKSYEEGTSFKEEEFVQKYNTDLDFRQVLMYIWKKKFKKNEEKKRKYKSIMTDFTPVANTLTDKDIITEDNETLEDVDDSDDDGFDDNKSEENEDF